MIQKPLKKNIQLCLDEDGKLLPRTFTIEKVMARGASVIAYEASYEHSGKGVLKEFYPDHLPFLSRDAEGQVICPADDPEAQDQFEAQKLHYLEPYKLLLDTKRAAADEEGLSTFLPDVEIHHGYSDGKKTGTVYIWSRNPKTETFAKFCDTIHEKPTEQPEHKLAQVIYSIVTLTKCIKCMHEGNLLHRDIKPANFGFATRSGETLTQSISLFDVNSFCSFFAENPDRIFSNGFTEPEQLSANYRTPNCRTDLYSIGATLFHALIVTEETKAANYLYHGSFFDDIPNLVKKSELISASESNSHPKLRDILCRILQKTLCPRELRYPNCDELLEDLERAKFYLLPSELRKKERSGQRWVLSDLAKELDKSGKQDTEQVLQHHLFDIPLYEHLSDADTALNIAVLGFGNYSQKFLDAALQLGQFPKKSLYVNIASHEIDSDKEVYLNERPVLSEFFDIDGSLADRTDAYGHLTFTPLTLNIDNDEQTIRAIQEHLQSLANDKRLPHYLFISLGDDELNELVAQACRDTLSALNRPCRICYARTLPDTPPAIPGITPVCIRKQKFPHQSMIERMAFNTHLVWQPHLNVPFKDIESDFKKPYNKKSCIDSVLSMKYKLYSMGIDLARVDLFEAAQQFSAHLSGSDLSKNPDFLELVALEHRRWVTEKVCAGWQPLLDLTRCADGTTKDDRRKLHVCLVRSTPTEVLSGWSHKDWDAPIPAALNRLDELDRMSVELHRMYLAQAAQARTKNLLSGNEMAAIQALIRNHRPAVAAFSEWRACLQNIQARESESVSRYKGLRSTFLNTLDALPDAEQTAIKQQVSSFEALFYPILASQFYRDYKKTDEDLVRNIPFILTYGKIHLSIPFCAQSHIPLFDYVAAATVISPAEITYMTLISRQEDVTHILDTLPKLASYMQKKNFRAQVKFLLIHDPELALDEDPELEQKFRTSSHGRVNHVQLLPAGRRDLSRALPTFLRAEQKKSKSDLFALEYNNTPLSDILSILPLEDMDTYSFRSASYTFDTTGKCVLFRYLPRKSFITVGDITALHQSSGVRQAQPEFFHDYLPLWRASHRDGGVSWKLLTQALGTHTKQNDTLASFPQKYLKPNEKKEPQRYTYILPFSCRSAAESILKKLIEFRIAGFKSLILGYSTEACKITIFDQFDLKDTYDELFSHVYELMFPEQISTRVDAASKSVIVSFDNLTVKNISYAALNPGNDDRTKANIDSLISYLREYNYLVCYRTQNDPMGNPISASFSFASPSVKRLLTKAGTILEIYAYHKAKEQNFDDVVTGYELTWNDTSVQNEFDLVITKQFRSLFVECKSRPVMAQDPVFKLSALTQKFGINATAVLITDTREFPGTTAAYVNKIQRERSEQLDIITIWKADEIDNIGDTLRRIIDGTYYSET